MRKISKKIVALACVMTMLMTMFSVSGLTLVTTAAEGTVLFTENFNSYANGTLPSDWKVSSDSGYNTVSIQNGALQIDGRGHDWQTRVVYLGSELMEKGNYVFEADYTIVASDYDLTSSTRYSSMMFRASSDIYPYYYITSRVRNNTTKNELSIRNNTDVGSYKQLSLVTPSQAQQVIGETYHLKVVCRGANIQYFVDGVLEFNYTLETSGTNYSYLDRGTIGFTTSNLCVQYDNIVVTETDVAAEIQPALYDTYIPTTDIINPPSIITNVTSSSVYSTLTGSKLPATTLYYLNSDMDITTPDGSTVIASLAEALVKTSGKVIPALYIKDKATADAFTSFVQAAALQDAFIVADDPEILKYTRQKNPRLYGVLYNKLTTAATRETLAQMVADTNASLGKTIMVNADYVSKEDVAYMQQRLMNVWVIDDMTTADVYDNLAKGVNGIITTDHGAAIYVLESFNEGTPVLVREPFLYAHRGYSAHTPQNTMPAFYAAIDNGADLIEMDVRLTSDGVVVLYHDNYLYSLTDCADQTKTVENTTYAELMTYNVDCTSGYSEKIPTLRQFLELIDETDDVVGIIEIKNYDYNLVKASADIVKEMGMEDKVVSICFGQGYAAYMREQLPEVSVGWLANGVAELDTPSEIINYAKNYIMAANMSYHPNYTQIQNYTTNAIVPNAIEAAAQRGITYQPWTYNGAVAFDTAYINGIQGLTTDYLEFDDGYVRKLSAGMSYQMKEGTATAIQALGFTSLGHDMYNCIFKRTGGAKITFTHSNGKTTASGTGLATGILMYKVTTDHVGDYYVISGMTSINVSANGGTTPTSNHHTSLLPGYVAHWVNSMSGMNINVTRSDRGEVLTNTTGSWPAVTTSCGQYASYNGSIYYDMSVGGATNIVITLSDGNSYYLQKYMNGVTLQGDDLVGNGESFVGSVKLSDMIPASAATNGQVIISSVRVFNVGDAGTEIVIRRLDLVEPVPATTYVRGDVNNDGSVNTTDARSVLYSVIGTASLNYKETIAADFNIDNKVTSSDARKILLYVVEQ